MTQNAASRLRLSGLDQSPIAEGSMLGGALGNSIDLAVLAESMGNRRYWLAEHHGSPGFGRMSPEILIGPIAAATSECESGAAASCFPITVRTKWLKASACSRAFSGRIGLGRL